MNNVKKLVPYLVMALVAAVLCVLLKDSLKAGPKVVSGLPQPTFTVTTRDGSTVDLRPRPGKFRIVHFWATWCAPCEEEMPGLLDYARSISSQQDVELLTVSVDDDWKTVDGWLEKRGGRDLPVLLDKGKRTSATFGTTKFPETYLISRTGEIVSRVEGPMDWKSADVRKRLEDLRKKDAGTSLAPG